jgi:hypothetical protein
VFLPLRFSSAARAILGARRFDPNAQMGGGNAVKHSPVVGHFFAASFTASALVAVSRDDP